MISAGTRTASISTSRLTDAGCTVVACISSARVGWSFRLVTVQPRPRVVVCVENTAPLASSHRQSPLSTATVVAGYGRGSHGTTNVDVAWMVDFVVNVGTAAVTPNGAGRPLVTWWLDGAVR